MVPSCLVMREHSTTGDHTIVIRTHEVPKKHVFPYVYTPYLVLIIMLCSPAIVDTLTNKRCRACLIVKVTRGQPLLSIFTGSSDSVAFPHRAFYRHKQYGQIIIYPSKARKLIGTPTLHNLEHKTVHIPGRIQCSARR